MGDTVRALAAAALALGAPLAAQTTVHQVFTPGQNPDGFGLGDASGDGVPDVAVTSLVGPGWAGAVDVLSGATTGTLFGASGAADGDQLGQILAGPGDVDGDGRDDVWAHGRFELPNTLRAWSGQDGSLPTEATLLTASGGPGLSGYNTSLAATGDLTGDGVPEVLVGDATFQLVRLLSSVDLPLHADVDVVHSSPGGAVQQALALDAGPANAGRPTSCSAASPACSRARRSTAWCCR